MPVKYDVLVPIGADLLTLPIRGGEFSFQPGENDLPRPINPVWLTVPGAVKTTSENERFRFFAIIPNPTDYTLYVTVSLTGRAYILVDTVSDTYYYRYYLARAIVSSLTETPSWTESTAMSYSRGYAGSQSWFEEPLFSHTQSVALPPRRILKLRFRGTCWTSGGNGNVSIGINYGVLRPSITVGVLP